MNPGGTASAVPPDKIRAIPVRHPGRWVAGAILAFFVFALVVSMVKNGNFEWGVVRQYMTDPRILRGLVKTLELTAAAMVIGIVLGVMLAVMRLSAEPGRRRPRLGLHLVLPRDARVRADPLLELHRRSVSACRHRDTARAAVHAGQRPDADHAVHRRDAGARAQRGRLHGRDRPGGDSLRRRRSDGGRAGARHDAAPDDAAGRAAAGDARDHPAERQRDDLDAEDDVARRRHRAARAHLHGPDHLRRELPDDPAPDRRSASGT